MRVVTEHTTPDLSLLRYGWLEPADSIWNVKTTSRLYPLSWCWSRYAAAAARLAVLLDWYDMEGERSAGHGELCAYAVLDAESARVDVIEQTRLVQSHLDSSDLLENVERMRRCAELLPRRPRADHPAG